MNTNTDSVQTESHKPSPVALPAIKVLFTESWELLSKKALKLLFLGLLSLAITVGFIVAGTAALFGSFAFDFALFSNPEALTKLITPAFFTTVFSIFGLMIVVGSVIGMAIQAATFLLLDDPKEETSIFTYFKKGFAYVLPLFVVGCITSFLMFGSFFLFLVPALIVGIFLMFTAFTIVIDGKKGLSALKMSASMVSQNFGGIIGRILLLWLLMFVIQWVMGMIGENIQGSSLGLFGLISMVISILTGFYSSIYVFVLYKHARASYDSSKTASLTWMWIVAILGWIIAVMFFMGMYNLLTSANFQDTIRDSINKEFEMDSSRKGTLNMLEKQGMQYENQEVNLDDFEGMMEESGMTPEQERLIREMMKQ